ncbi:MAG: isoleucine--tRNA ligase [Bacteroidota bacterium]
MKYREYKGINYAAMANEVLEKWKKDDVFVKSVTSREDGPSFTFYEGPPSANGTPGIHHVMARAVKDIFCRYKTQKGFQVKRKGGWDTHGLPVELQVEKELGITKEDIGTKISVEEYNLKCKEAVMKYKDQWDDLTEKMGYWVDLSDPYITFDRNYMETLWWLLKKLYDKDLLYEGFTIQPYSPAAGTGLSSHELNQPGCYKDVKDTTVVAQFKIVDKEDEFILAWTTTPWTLAGNSALAVGKNIDYVKVATFNQYTHEPIKVIAAKDRFSYLFNPKAADLKLEDYKPGDKLIPYEVLEEFKGKDLVDIRYEQLFPYVKPTGDAFRVIEGDFVTTEDGTGVVHISPTFGADDFRAAKKAGIGAILVKDKEGKNAPIVDKQGRYVEEMGEFAGMYVKNEYYGADAPDKSLDVLLTIKLKEENRAFKAEKYEHSYPHCWRTDKPVLYYPMDSWFIKTTAFKDRLVELNNTINWKPTSTGSGRFGNWLENLVDWNLSRSRYWGTPLPIWKTEDKKEELCIGSLQELREEADKAVEAGFMKESLPEDFDLHRPYVDDVVLVSPSGKKMNRVKDLIDVWFDSGAMPYAQWHYPFENKEIFDNSYPADFIAEGVDQTRGWFFTLHAIAGILFDSVSFKNVIANGLVLDKEGNKMSKRLNNAVDPFETIEKYGPDALRWYMIANANPWDNLKFNVDGVAEAQRRFFGTLHNTYSFFALYANLDNYQGEQVQKEFYTESDRWVLSRLNSLIKFVDKAYDDYEPTRAARAIQDFTIDDLSNWYVRLNRKRFWKGEYNDDKIAAYHTLYTCLINLAHLASPVAPFYTDKMFHNLNDVTGEYDFESVHLSEFPKVNEEAIDKDLEEKMGLAQKISSLVHSMRKKNNIKVRQPLSKILIPVLDESYKQHIQEVEKLILHEINTKKVEYLDDGDGVFVKKIKPNFRKLGKQYGPKMKEITGAISTFQQEDIAALESTGQYELQLSDQTITLTLEDVEIGSEDIPGWVVASEGQVTVALDIEITEELREEGLARDLVNRIQNMRKDMGLDVQDKIQLGFGDTDDLVKAAISRFGDYICVETQAKSYELKDNLPDGTDLEIDQHKLKIKIEA